MTPKTRRVSVTEAARNFADLVNRAYYRQETTVLLKNGVPERIWPPSPQAECRLMSSSSVGAGDLA
jgi:hypothetical protein